jgi:AFG3 family protein
MLRGFSRLLNVPRGFGKYYPKGAQSGSKNGKSSSKSSFSGNNGGGGSGGDGKKPDFPNNIPEGPWRHATLGLAILTSALIMWGGETKQGREISWQEFQSQLLESGMVDRIVVTNKNVARVSLRHVGNVDSSFATETDRNNSSLFSQKNFGEMNTNQNNNNNSNNKSDSANFTNNHNNSNNHEMIMSSGSAFDQQYHQQDHQHNSTADNDSKSNVRDNSSTNSVDQTENSQYVHKRYPRLGNPNPTNSSTPYYFAIGSVESFERKLEEAQRGLNINPRDYIPVIYVNETSWRSEMMRFGPTLFLIGAYFFIMRSAGGGIGTGANNVFKIGKSTAKKINKEHVTTTSADVAGCDEAKAEIMEFIDFLKDPKRFTDLGAKIPKGALLCGPPGTGKTLLAKATAGEANVPFYSISGSDFVEMFVGVGPSRVRDLFKEARSNAPCIVFIDEIDAVGRHRGKGGFSGSNDERENTLNQLLVEMDGFDTSSNVVLLAGTNRVDILDNALTRAGRFDRQITGDKPDIKGRKAIFDVHLQGLNLAGDISEYSARLAALTPGFVGADIANMCNEAAIIAARSTKSAIELDDFEKATDRLIGGLESGKIMSAEEKKVVAYHEAGHAVAGWNLQFADPLLKVTIVPRGSGALGYAQYLPKEIFLRTRAQILDMVCMALAGRAAEQVFFGRVTTGAADDLRRVTQIVYQMVQVYGMNDSIGQLSFPKEEGMFPDRLYSDATAEAMDAEVKGIVTEAYERTIELMKERKDQVEAVAELLLEKETITNEDVTLLIGPRPHSAGEEYEEYVNSWEAMKKEKADKAKPTEDSEGVTPSFATKKP